MSFLRRLLGGSGERADERSGERADERSGERADERSGERPESARSASAEPGPVAGGDEADERAFELELLREEQGRLDELRQRQLRYADRSWTPPPQGGERRADDEGPAEA